MGPTKINIEMYRGEDKLLTWQMLPVPTSILGWSLEMTIRNRITDAVLLTKTNGSGITITNAAQGLATILFLSADTKDLDFGGYLYRYDIQRVDLANRTELTIGNFLLRKQQGDLT